MNIAEIKSLAELMQQNDLSSLEVAEGDFKLRLERTTTVTAAPVQQQAAPATVVEVTAAAVQTAAPAVASRGTTVKSPMVGVFYASPSPDAQAFVTIGSPVQKGDVLCVLEAMKLMNEVVAECDGVITDICLKNGDLAEYGQPLFIIE